MRNMLSDELGNYFDNYDIVFVDVPYIDNNNYKNRELEIKMTQYRYDCEDIIFRVTNKNYEEKQIYYSMGLLCLSSYLKKHIKEIKLGYVHYYLNYAEFDTFIGKTKVVAFSTMTVTMQLINILIKKAKDINPNITVILGGYHVSFYAKETLQNNPFVDFVILKEGEQALLALFEKRDIDYIEGIAYRNQDGDIRINEFVHYLNPEEIPSPDYSLIDKYLDKMNIQLSTMRGCIGRCNFCVNHNYWKFPRLREIHNIVEELQYLKSVLPRGTIIHIIDNIFTLNEIHLKNILKEMIRTNLLGYFFFECDTLCSCIDSKKVSLIKKIGVIKICLGIEDSDDSILDISNKKVKFSDNIKAAILIKKTAPDICVYAYWIIGLPGSTISSLKSNLYNMKALIEKGIIDIISPKVFIPYPGSVFYDDAAENGINELSKDWELYERREPPYPYKYKKISQNDLYLCLLEAFSICHSAYGKKFGGEIMQLWDYNEQNADEMWDIYDKDHIKKDYLKKRKSKLTDDEYHLVVRTWIVNSQGEILLSQRGQNKRGPLLWECTAGSAIAGETNIDTINREVLEELGIDLSDDTGIQIVNTRRDEHHDFYEVWLYKKDIALNEIHIDGVEVIDVKWVSLSTLEKMIANNELMPTLTEFPDLYRKYINKI